MMYLLSENKDRDKSLFLKKVGYSADAINDLMNEIILGTDFNTLLFEKINNFTFNAKAKTILKGYVVTTAWQIRKDGTIRLITFIPGGDKIWK